MEINDRLVKQLIIDQFPLFAELEIKQVKQSGHDNRTYHLGDKMSVRLPSALRYASQIEKESKWLPQFKPNISIKIPTLIAKGKPSDIYPFEWAINEWIEGETVSDEFIEDQTKLAIDLAAFLKELQKIDATNGPAAGAHNFFRGGTLDIYAQETEAALDKVKHLFNVHKLKTLWDEALISKFSGPPVWVHGDVAVGNLLVKEGKLNAVIDFGILGVGDPACDYVMAWTYFDATCRQRFKEELNCDIDTWKRAKGWALWKALICFDVNNQHSDVSKWSARTLNELLRD